MILQKNPPSLISLKAERNPAKDADFSKRTGNCLPLSKSVILLADWEAGTRPLVLFLIHLRAL
jgi:hypothetical protein